jgi:hypothetical protein
MQVTRARRAVVRDAVAALCACIVAASAARAQATGEPWVTPSAADSARLLYKGYGYGSDAYNTPFTVLLNKGFDIFQLRHSPRNVWSFPYTSGWRYGFVDAVTAPGAIVNRFGGWGRYARIELYPSSLDPDGMNWLVNYTEHLLGGGLTMRMLDEWYRAHGVPFPRVAASVTTYAASIMNEITEQGDYPIPTPGNVADLLIFDLGAVVLFHWDQPTRFFARTLQLADWSNQASFTFPNQQLQNNGQYLTMKIPVGLNRTRVFLRGGMGVQLGVSRKTDDAHHLSIGVGGDTQVRDIDATGHETVGFAPGAGIYYDRNNSLLWSVTSSPAANLVTVNVYPGVLPGAMGGAGVWAVVTRDNELRVGLIHRRALGLGLGYGR